MDASTAQTMLPVSHMATATPTSVNTPLIVSAIPTRRICSRCCKRPKKMSLTASAAFVSATMMTTVAVERADFMEIVITAIVRKATAVERSLKVR